MILGVDFSAGSAHWSAAKCASFAKALKASGRVFACVYLGTDWGSGKGLSVPLFQALVAQGIKIVFLLEYGTTDSFGGSATAIAHVTRVKKELGVLGVDWTHQPVVYCTDTDATEAQVDAYYREVGTLVGIPNTWAYGGYTLIKALFDKGLISGALQAKAWSKVDPVTGKESYAANSVLRWEPRAQIRQHGENQTTVVIDGTSCNADSAYPNAAGDFGQYPRPGVPAPTPPPTPALDKPALFTTNAHAKIGWPYGWSHEGEFPIGNPVEHDMDCSGYVFVVYTETDMQVLKLDGHGMPWRDGSRWYTDPTHNHRMTAAGYCAIATPIPRTGPFQVGDMFFHHEPVDVHHVGFFCHQENGVWWTCEERNGAEHHPVNDPKNGVMVRYSAAEVTFGRFSWINWGSPIPAPAPPDPRIPLAATFEYFGVDPGKAADPHE